MVKFLRERMKPHHFHFAHGWLWGVIALAVAILLYVGFRDGYFRYWLGNGYKITNVHEVIQSEREANKLGNVMRHLNIKQTVLVGAPNELIYYDGTKDFSGYKENNTAILGAAKKDSRFIPFCTFDPTQPNYMQTVADCVSNGAKGFKLYTGHSFFYNKPLNDPGIFPFYAYAEERKLPVIFHANAAKYQEEFEDVLKLYPDMKVVCPHFCLTSSNLQRLSYLFDTYPNLYSDLSFGDEVFLREGLDRIDRDTTKYREFISKYADRFFYGTDIIITDYEGKNVEWLKKLFQTYRDILEKEEFSTFIAEDPSRVYKGLHLDRTDLQKIYQKNWKTLVGE